MGRLKDEIIRFLEDKGFHCSDDVPEGVCTGLIRTAEPQRWILPLEITATTPQEAEAQAMEPSEKLEEVKKRIGENPVIIPEDRWRSRPGMMKERLLAHLGRHSQVYARNCEVRRLEKAEAAAFLHRTHSYGDAACRYRYGLFLKRHTGHVALEGPSLAPGDLVAVATFSNARKWTKGDKIIRSYEWTRYASLPDIRVSGGMGKLLKAFISEIAPDDIMSYSDLEWSEGAVYEQLGFIREGHKSPVCFRIPTSTWERSIDLTPSGVDERFFMNSGSAKFRMKLTEYE